MANDCVLNSFEEGTVQGIIFTLEFQQEMLGVPFTGEMMSKALFTILSKQSWKIEIINMWLEHFGLPQQPRYIELYDSEQQ